MGLVVCLRRSGEFGGAGGFGWDARFCTIRRGWTAGTRATEWEMGDGRGDRRDVISIHGLG